MPPSAIIDVCYQKRFGTYWALEEAALWRADNISAAGAATWTQVLDAATYTDLVGLKLCRVVGAPNSESRVYVLAVADGETSDMGYMFRSNSKGLTWTYAEIAETGMTGDLPFALSLDTAFEMSNAVSTISESLGERGGSLSVMGKRTNGTQQFPSITDGSYALDPPTAMTSAKIRITGTPMNGDSYSSAVVDPDMAARPYFWNNDFEDFSTGSPAAPTAASVYEYSAITPSTIYSIIFNRGHLGDSRADSVERNYVWTWEIIEWNGEQIGTPTAMDVAATNSDWLYVGFKEEIYKSIDGGFTWTLLTDAYGAYDIKVNPLLAGVITFWTPDGELRQSVGGVVQATALLTGATAVAAAHRIAYDPANGGKIWVLAHTDSSTADLKRWYLGSFSDQVTGISGAAGINAFTKSGGLNYVMYLSGSDIHLSDDDGATFGAKIGDWSGYSGPILGHLL